MNLDESNREMEINSGSENSIAILENKKWKTCTKNAPWIVQLEYETVAPSDQSETGLAFYTNTDSTDHYYINVHPISKEVRFGFSQDGAETDIVKGSGVLNWEDGKK
eukprot:TRINITY_DN12250_c0_g1_i1.p1 TRINITY_DN12250_c0_g1~~TRINITY_DN12250_c0_g1_i1.p1  ORF type:complete len:107 (-),score=18.07 TRINITY_DN12250_c0_g1_i1:170-490(-)